MYKKQNIVTIKVRTLEWAGHLIRMSCDRAIKKVFLGKPDGRRKTGRLKLRWLNSTENNLKSIGATRWRRKAQARFAWAIILKKSLGNYKDHISMKKKTKIMRACLYILSVGSTVSWRLILEFQYVIK
jgi:hypothetical protein